MSKSNNESSNGTHVDMLQPMSGRKSTIKDMWIGYNPKNHLEVDKCHERTSSLDLILTKLVGRREGERGERQPREKREKKKRVLERESIFSLDFPTIDLSNPDKTRGKVDPHCKSYKWVPVLWSFDNFGR